MTLPIQYMVLYFISRFFLGTTTSDCFPKSTILQRLQESVTDFQKLFRKNLNWNSGRPGYHSEDEDSQVEYLDLSLGKPIPRKRNRDTCSEAPTSKKFHQS